MIGPKVILDHATASLPTRGYHDDAGFDLYTSVETKISAGTFNMVPIGIRMEMPPGYWYLILGRSSAIYERRLLVIPSVIDPGYRGPLFVGVQNIGDLPQVVKIGDRIGQAVPFPTCNDGWQAHPVFQLSETERGAGGFGSTGR